MQTEFRLYHDDDGNPLFYTGEKPEGKFIVIDAATFAQARVDVKVIDGKIVNMNKPIIAKLIPEDRGVNCISEDVSIISNGAYTGSTTNWKLKIYDNR